MFIHQITVSQGSARKLNLYDEYSLHKLVYSQFPMSRTEEQLNQSVSSGIQWQQVNKQNSSKDIVILVLSDREIEPTNDIQVKTNKITDQYFSFNKYRFEIVVNPTYVCGETKKRKAFHKAEDISRWFEWIASKSGFKPEQFSIEQIQTSKFRKKNATIKLVKAEIIGVLTIQDLEHFKTVFSKGLGRSRSFGCGLLQIIPIA